MSSLNTSVVEMVKSIKKGEITSEALVKNYIREIKKKEKDVGAWEFFDEELAIAQAKKLDLLHQSGNHVIFMAFQLVLKIFLIQPICQQLMEPKFTKKIQVSMIVRLFRN